MVLAVVTMAAPTIQAATEVREGKEVREAIMDPFINLTTNQTTNQTTDPTATKSAPVSEEREAREDTPEDTEDTEEREEKEDTAVLPARLSATNPNATMFISKLDLEEREAREAREDTTEAREEKEDTTAEHPLGTTALVSVKVPATAVDLATSLTTDGNWKPKKCPPVKKCPHVNSTIITEDPLVLLTMEAREVREVREDIGVHHPLFTNLRTPLTTHLRIVLTTVTVLAPVTVSVSLTTTQATTEAREVKEDLTAAREERDQRAALAATGKPSANLKRTVTKSVTPPVEREEREDTTEDILDSEERVEREDTTAKHARLSAMTSHLTVITKLTTDSNTNTDSDTEAREERDPREDHTTEEREEREEREDTTHQLATLPPVAGEATAATHRATPAPTATEETAANQTTNHHTPQHLTVTKSAPPPEAREEREDTAEDSTTDSEEREEREDITVHLVRLSVMILLIMTTTGNTEQVTTEVVTEVKEARVVSTRFILRHSPQRLLPGIALSPQSVQCLYKYLGRPNAFVPI